MSTGELTKDQKIILALLASAKTNSRIIQVLYMLRGKTAPEDEELKVALDELSNLFEEQVDRLEKLTNG